ncbi:MAG: MBL fold metallo-hydrolase [Actinomycetota bacterium]
MSEPRLLADNVVRLGTSYVNWYLVADESGVTIVDAGVPGYRPQLEPGLKLLGRSIDNVRCVLLTHGDADHTGVAEKLRSENGIEVHLHPEDEKLVHGESKKTEASALGMLTHVTAYRLLWHFVRNGAARPPQIEKTTPLVEGATLQVPGRPHVIETPGHTPGHVAFHFPEHGAVFAGDALCTWNPMTGDRGPQLMPRSLNVSTATARESLAKIERLDAPLVLPGHGEPWTEGAAAAVEHVRDAPLT